MNNIANEKPILEQLEKNGIFGISKESDGYLIMECCDYYYKRTLTKEEMLKLIVELQELVESD